MLPIMNAWYMAAGPRMGKYVSGSTIQMIPNVAATAAKAIQSCAGAMSSPPAKTRYRGPARRPAGPRSSWRVPSGRWCGRTRPWLGLLWPVRCSWLSLPCSCRCLSLVLGLCLVLAGGPAGHVPGARSAGRRSGRRRRGQRRSRCPGPIPAARSCRERLASSSEGHHGGGHGERPHVGAGLRQLGEAQAREGSDQGGRRDDGHGRRIDRADLGVTAAEQRGKDQRGDHPHGSADAHGEERHRENALGVAAVAQLGAQRAGRDAGRRDVVGRGSDSPILDSTAGAPKSASSAMATSETASEGPIAETAPDRNDVLMSPGVISTEGAARRTARRKISDWTTMTAKTPATQSQRMGALAIERMSVEPVGAMGACMRSSWLGPRWGRDADAAGPNRRAAESGPPTGSASRLGILSGTPAWEGKGWRNRPEFWLDRSCGGFIRGCLPLPLRVLHTSGKYNRALFKRRPKEHHV